MRAGEWMVRQGGFNTVGAPEVSVVEVQLTAAHHRPPPRPHLLGAPR